MTKANFNPLALLIIDPGYGQAGRVADPGEGSEGGESHPGHLKLMKIGQSAHNYVLFLY